MATFSLSFSIYKDAVILKVEAEALSTKAASEIPVPSPQLIHHLLCPKK